MPMELTLPKPLDERLSAQAVALHLAIGLFVTEEATLGQAAQIAGLTQAGFRARLRKSIASDLVKQQRAVPADGGKVGIKRL